MNNKFKCLLAFVLALSLFIAPFTLYISDNNTVSAFSTSVTLPENPSYANNANRSTYDSAFEALKTNPQFMSISTGYVFCTITNNQFYGVILEPTAEKTNVTFATYNDILLYGNYASIACNVSELPTYQINFVSSDTLPSTRPSTNTFNSVLYSTVPQFKFYITGAYLNNNNVSIGNSVNASAVYPFDNAYTPNYSGLLVGFPVGLEFSVADFMQWLVDNDKIDVSADSGGVSVGGKIPAYIGMSKLKSFLEFYKTFGSSNSSFVQRIGSWFSYMNIANQTNDNIIILKSTIDSLYREYINSYKHEFYSNSADQAHHRRNVNTQTTDDDLTLVTDDANDDIYTTLLREIIRGIVALQSSTVSGCRAIIDTLNNLDISVNLANNGGNNPFIDFSSLYSYDSDAFNDDLQTFQDNIEDVQSVPQGYIDTIGQNSLMPENMLSDKNSLTVNVPCIAGFTIGNYGSTYSTQTGTFTLSSSDYPWLDAIVKKIKRFASIILILGYLVHLRYRIPELVRGE